MFAYSRKWYMLISPHFNTDSGSFFPWGHTFRWVLHLGMEALEICD